MHAKLRILAAATAVAAATISLQGLPQANAATESFAHAAYAGGTKITAVGTTISSDLTAESGVAGKAPAADTNKVASVRVAGLVQTGAVTTDASAVKSGIGFKTTAHSRTANVNLLNGLIKISAVDTTSTAESNGTTPATGSSSTEFVGLTIAGKKYPINVPANTGINIPGVARVTINASQTATSGDSVVTQGAGLYVTLLKARNGVAAGAEIMLNPTYTLITPTSDTEGGYPLGGGGFGAYAFAHVGDEIEAETGQLGGKMMPPLGTNGVTQSNTTARINLPQLLTVKGIESTVTGISTPALSEATVTSKLADLKLFPTLTGGLITATAIGSTSHVRLDGGTPITEGSLQFINLRVAGKTIPVDVAPNTTINVAGLGKVVINEHKQLRAPGAAHGYQVIALHITLDTKKAGLPIGAEIQIGASQAYVYG
ncbi:MAG TPA: choice-of-anchor P family protein [Acidimicrobiia bacterium]|nr:choice-of-anchor P family protein [Acidimicrobiia bacterium]